METVELYGNIGNKLIESMATSSFLYFYSTLFCSTEMSLPSLIDSAFLCVTDVDGATRGTVLANVIVSVVNNMHQRFQLKRLKFQRKR